MAGFSYASLQKVFFKLLFLHISFINNYDQENAENDQDTLDAQEETTYK